MSFGAKEFSSFCRLGETLRILSCGRFTGSYGQSAGPASENRLPVRTEGPANGRVLQLRYGCQHVLRSKAATLL